MKIKRNEPVFEPIVITIESIAELKWMLAVANTSVSGARQQTSGQGFDLESDSHIQQLALWDGIKQYQELVQ